MSDSTIEAKYKALSEAAKDVVHIHRLILELGLLPNLMIPLICQDTTIHTNLADAATPSHFDLNICCNNQGSIKLAKNLVFHAKMKHIEGKHQFIRGRVLAGEINLHYIKTDDNTTDILIKLLIK